MIVRAPREDRYTILNRTLIDDARLSFRALGLLTYILDKPDNWRIDATDLAAGENREGRDAVRTALRELEAAGYLRRKRIRLDDGTFSMESTIFEKPIEPATGNPSSVEPAPAAQPSVVGKPATGNPSSEDQSISTRTVNEDCAEVDAPVPASVAAQQTPSPSRRGAGSAACRTRNPLFDALVVACGMAYDEMTEPARKRTGVAAAQLLRVGATPEEVARRADIYRQVHTASLTPTALSSQWAACREVQAPIAPVRSNAVLDALRAYAESDDPLPLRAVQ